MSPSHMPALTRSTTLVPLERLTRVQLVAERLAEAIQLGLFGQHDRLPNEADLSNQLGVAPVTLREALTILRTRGLVETRRGRTGGTFVNAPPRVINAFLRDRLQKMTLNELRDLGDMHSATLGQAAYLAAQRSSELDVQRLRYRLAALTEPESREDAVRAHSRFYVEIAAASHSTRLTNQEMSLQGELAPLFRIAADHLVSSVEPYSAIITAIAAHNPDQARALVVGHITQEHTRLYARALELAAAVSAEGGSAHHEGTRSPRETLEHIEEIIRPVFASLDIVRDAAVSTLLKARERGDQPTLADIEPIRPTVWEQLENHRGLVSGAGMVFAHGVLADAPHWLDWWCSTPDEEPSFLIVVLDPSSPEFYDYETTEWYSVTARTRQPQISGPSIDCSGTDQNNLTLTVPMQVDGDFLGVAGADVALAALETAVTPLLRRMDVAGALLDQHNRVLASTDLRWQPGTLASGPGWSVGHQSGQLLPWTLITSPRSDPASDR